ncbi:MAG: hypothetical protein KAG34_06635 [Cocleimonas sp.]|nr:hypothetical protein [Cocleimonas sp.]
MKNKVALTALVSLLAAVSFSTASASGMTYDPMDNYYAAHYGEVSTKSITTVSSVSAQQQLASDIGPHNGYYATYYGTGVETKQASAEITDTVLNNEMANPMNYFNW